MSPFDDMPNIPPCPKCGHAGDGLNWAFPIGENFKTVQCACLACGFHGAEHASYDEAAKAFKAAAVKARNEASAAKYRKERHREEIQHAGPKFLAVLEQIADGHNDPRSLAQEVIAPYIKDESL